MNIFKELYDYRTMIGSLVKREIRGKYKGSVLGIFWAFLSPLLQLFVYTIVFSIIMRAGIEKYYLFLFVAMIPWIFFSESVARGSTSIIENKEMVKKIYFPRQVLPIATVTSAFVNMLIGMSVVLVVVAIAKPGIKVGLLIYFIPIFFAEYLLSLGMCLIVSAITVYLKDIQFFIGILMMAWQFLSPVMYSIDMVPEELRAVFMCNPMTPVLLSVRDVLYYQQTPKLNNLLMTVAWGIVAVVFGWALFSKLQKRFVEEL